MNADPKCRHYIWFTPGFSSPCRVLPPSSVSATFLYSARYKTMFHHFSDNHRLWPMVNSKPTVFFFFFSWQSISQRRNKHCPNSETDAIMLWPYNPVFLPVYKSNSGVQSCQLPYLFRQNPAFALQKLRSLLSEFGLLILNSLTRRTKFIFSILKGILMSVASP